MAALAAGASANAEIIYTDIADVDVAYNDSYDVNLDNNGTADFTIRRQFQTSSAYPLWYKDQAGIGAAIYSQYDNQILGYYGYAYGLNLGSTISNGAGGYYAGWDDNYYNYRNFGSVSAAGGPYGYVINGGDKYIGVRFDISGNRHYGWIRVNYTGLGALIVKDYAYESCPGVAIQAGATTGGPTECPVVFCDSEADDSGDTNIEEVVFNTINNNTAGICATYSDFTSISTSVEPGVSYTLSVTTGTCGGDYSRETKAYIDWNGNGVFDLPDEEVMSETWVGVTTTYNITVDVPAGLSADTVRMRVITSEDGGVTPCGSYSYGETEDYTIIIDSDICTPATFSQDLEGCSSVTYNGDTYFSNVTVYDTLVGQAANGCDSIVETNVTVYEALSAVAEDDFSVCSDAAGTLNVSLESYGGDINAGLWTSNGTGTFTIDNQPTATYEPSMQDLLNGSVTFNVELFSDNCPSISDQVTVTFQAPPSVSVGNDLQLCTGNPSVSLNGLFTGAAGVEWSTAGNGTFANDTDASTSYTFGGADAGGVTLTLTTTGNGVCTEATDDITITFGTESIFSQDINDCEEVTYNGITYTNNTTVYDTIVGGAVGGCDSIVETNISIDEPGVLQLMDDFTACSDEISIDLEVVADANLAGGFWSTSGTGSLVDNEDGTASYFPSQADIDNGVITVFANAFTDNSCPDVSDELIVTLQTAPTANAGNDIQLCVGTLSTALNGVVTGATGVQWSTTGNGTFDDDTNTATDYTFGVADAGGVTLALVTTGNGVCDPAADQVNITFGAETILTYDITDCDDYFVGGATQTVSGTYYDTITGGTCDSIIITNLTLGKSTSVTTNVTIEEGESYFAEGAEQTTSGTYTDSYLTAEGCDSLIITNLTVNEAPESIANIQDQKVSVYPNPSSGVYNLDLTGLVADKVDFLLTDNVGRVIKSVTNVSSNEIQQLDLSEVEDGIYFLFIKNEQFNATIKLVKKK